MKKLILLSMYLCFYALSAQQPGSIDTSFNPNDSGYGLWDGANDDIYATVIQNDGKIIIGGKFTTYNTTWTHKIIRLNVDGSVDTSFLPYTLPNSVGSVSQIVLQNDGKIIVRSVVEFTSNYFARLNPDGSIDNSFAPPLIPSLSGITVLENGKILVSGYNGVLRLNTDGSIDTTFNENGMIPVERISVQPDGKIILNGFYGYLVDDAGIATTLVKHIIRLNSEGTIDFSFNTGTNFKTIGDSDQTERTRNISILPDGKIMICGSFDLYNNNLAKGIVRLNADGTIDSSFNCGYNGYHDVDIDSFTIQSDGKIVISGYFREVYAGNGGPAPYVLKTVRLNSDGTIDSSYNIIDIKSEYASTYTGDYNHVRIFSQNLQSDGKIIVSGRFTSINGVGRNNIARLNEDGSLDNSFSTGIGLGARDLIRTSCLQSDGKILIGGDFTSYNGVLRNRIARINSDGSLDETFNSGICPNYYRSDIKAIKVQQDGKIVVSSRNYFSLCSNNLQKSIVRLNNDGSIDSTFNYALTYGANTLLIQPDGKIICVVGARIYRLNSDGTLDSSFETCILNYEAFSIAIQLDGKLVIGGVFSLVNNVPRNHIARLNTNGSLDLSFNSPNNSSYFINTLFIQDDGKILAGGGGSGGANAGFLGRLEANGDIDPSFNSVSGPNNIVHSVIQQTDGKIIISGVFTKYNNITRNYITRLNNDGSLDNSFNIGLGANNIINTSLLQDDGKIIIAGSFTSYDVFGRNRITRIHGGTSLSTALFDLSDKLFFYPNPTQNNITFNKEVKTVSVYTLDGKLLNTQVVNNQIDLSSFNPGIYLVRGTTNNGVTFSEKLVKN